VIAGKANWQNRGWVGLGAGAALQQRTGVTSTQATYTDVSIGGSAIYAGALKRGTDRLWLVDAQANQARYTPDDFTTISNSFAVGDDQRELTGIGTLGPYTIYGALDGLFAFTDAGKPVLVDDLEGEESPSNGLKQVSVWGWNYAITDLGLIAWTPNVANPVGIEAMRDFEGAIDGRPTALWSWHEQLFTAYLTTAGDTYIVRGVFGPETADAGVPIWYPFKKMTGVECHLLYSTSRSFATNSRIVAGRGTNMTTYIMGRRGRDIADPNYAFSTEGGSWYGTTMMRSQALHKYVRYFSFFTEQCTSARTWQLAVSADGDSYVNVGAPVTTNGHQIVRPVTGGAPVHDMDFHTLKPRLTQVNDSATAPPQIRGKLSLIYDERPDVLEEVDAFVRVNAGTWDRLVTLAGHEQHAPVAISLPGDRGTHYGFVTNVGPRQDHQGDAIEVVQVTLQLWNVD
jgi:hypothetical protein